MLLAAHSQVANEYMDVLRAARAGLNKCMTDDADSSFIFHIAKRALIAGLAEKKKIDEVIKGNPVSPEDIINNHGVCNVCCSDLHVKDTTDTGSDSPTPVEHSFGLCMILPEFVTFVFGQAMGEGDEILLKAAILGLVYRAPGDPDVKAIMDGFGCQMTLSRAVFQGRKICDEKAINTAIEKHMCVKLSCGHIFHERCLKHVLSKNNRCPMCTDIVFERCGPMVEHFADNPSDPESIDGAESADMGLFWISWRNPLGFGR